MENLETRTDDGAWWEWLGIRPRRDGMALACIMGALVDWLRENGFAVTTSRNVVRAGLRLGAWMSQAGVTLNDLDLEVITAMIATDNTAHPSHRVSNESTSAVVGFLKSAGYIKPPAVSLQLQSAAQVCCEQWCESLKVQEYGTNWIAKARSWVSPFLKLLDDGTKNLCWQRANASSTNNYIVTCTQGYSVSTRQSVTALVRALLRWAYVEGHTGRDESIGVLSVRRSASHLPLGISPEQLESLKASIRCPYGVKLGVGESFSRSGNRLMMSNISRAT